MCPRLSTQGGDTVKIIPFRETIITPLHSLELEIPRYCVGLELLGVSERLKNMISATPMSTLWSNICDGDWIQIHAT